MRRLVLIGLFSLSFCLSGVGVTAAQGQEQSSKFEGIWSGTITTPLHEFWNVEDFMCFAGCPVVGYEYNTSLLDDPANDERPLDELNGQTIGFMREHLAGISTEEGLRLQQSNNLENDTNFICLPYGYVREVLNPLPMEIIRRGQTLIFDYEEWNLERTVYMDGRDFPANIEKTALGYSIGHFDGQALVIETRGLEAEVYVPFMTGGAHSDQLVGIERYILSENDTVITAILTLDDPVTLTDSLVLTKHWVLTPDLVIVEDSCVDMPGQP